MRYLITVSSLTPGSGLSRYVFSLCRLLVKGGNEVYVLTTHDDSTISYERNELDSISKGIHLISLGHKNKLGKYIEVVRAVNRIHPEVIINNYNAVVQYILPFISNKIKIIHVLHNDTDDFYRIGSINGAYTDGWIAPTEAIAEHFNHYTVDKYRDRVTTIAHGVEAASYHKRMNSRIEIVYAGVLYEHKGVKILPTVIKQLCKNGYDFHFTIVGGGKLSEWLKEQFCEEINSGIVTMTGVIPHSDVYDLMSKADIFLYPTHLDAFGLVIAEAMMNGAVPVVTLLRGITDRLVDNEVNGFLLNQDDINAFVKTLSLLINNHELRIKLSEAAHSKSLNFFSMEKMEINYRQYFSQLK